MIEFRWKSLAYIFFLCFGSFLLGWMTAVFIIPGRPLAQKTGEVPMEVHLQTYQPDLPVKKAEPTTTIKASSFFKELKNDILFLFDPYKMDTLIKKNTFLENSTGSALDQNKQAIMLKKNPLVKKQKEPSPNKLTETLDQKEQVPKPTLEKLIPSGMHPLNKNEQALVTLQKLQLVYDKQNQEQFPKNVGEDKIFAIEGKFSFLVNVFSKQDKALEFVQEMKDKYPLWSFFLKANMDHIRIYLGPFPSRKKALEFKQSQPYPLPFSQDFLEEVSL